MRRPVIFVGSSTEAKTHEIQVRCYLENADARILNWHDVFKPGGYPLDALEIAAASVDGALLIATPDDIVTSRGLESSMPRDNILVELGYFTAALGRRRTSLVQVHGAEMPRLKLPSDLEGLTILMYDVNRAAVNERALLAWLDNVRSISESESAIRDRTAQIEKALSGMPTGWLPLISNTLVDRQLRTLARASRGTIELTLSDYYRLIYREMDRAGPHTLVRAVASFSPTRWVHNEDQRGYVKRNIAAAKRGAKIRRLFVLPGDIQSAVAEIARRMTDAGIEIRFAKPGLWGPVQKIQDMVMFTDDAVIASRAYFAHPDPEYPLRIDSAELKLDPMACSERAEVFDTLWEWAADIQTYTVVVSKVTDSSPPGHRMATLHLDQAVITCQEAAVAKEIPLAAELKTLILETSCGIVAVHVPGDRVISLRAVKKTLRCKEARLASRAKLSSVGLAPGTVCPVLDPVWGMKHLLCESVLGQPVVSTNNGTLAGYFKFKPDLLLEAPNITLGVFSNTTV